MAVAAEGLLLKRLQRVLGQWPTDASRKGRDLGEFLSQRYKAKFQEEILSDVRWLFCYTPLSLLGGTSNLCSQ